MVFLISLKGWGWISYHIFCYSHKDNNKICCFSHDLLNSIQEKEEELLESFFFHQNGTRKLLLAIWFEKLEYLYARMNIPLANWRIDASVMHQRNIHLQYDFCTFGVSNQKSSDLIWLLYVYKICPSKIRISTVVKNKIVFFIN